MKEEVINQRTRLPEGRKFSTTCRFPSQERTPRQKTRYSSPQLMEHNSGGWQGQGTSRFLAGGTAAVHFIIHIMKKVRGDGCGAEPKNPQGITAGTTYYCFWAQENLEAT